MLTMLILFALFVVIVPSALAAQQWLFKGTDEVYDRQWELYQQRYD